MISLTAISKIIIGNIKPKGALSREIDFVFSNTKIQFHKLFKYSCLVAVAFGGWLMQAPAMAAIGDNIALSSNGGTASQSSYYNASWAANRCIDGVITGSSNSVLCHTSSAGNNEWWDLELASNESINSIVIHNRTSCCTNRILNVYVLVSDTPFPSGKDAASLATARAQASFEYQITADTTITTIALNNLYGQYIRLQKAGGGENVNGNAINLLEVEVFEGGGIVDLQLSKSVSNRSPNLGDSINFELVVTNQGPDDAFDVSVEDSLPEGFGNISNISNAGVLNAAGTINWTIASIPNGASQTLSFDAVVIAP